VVCVGSDALLEPGDVIAPLGVQGRELEALGVDVSKSVFLGLDGPVAWFGVDAEPVSANVRARLQSLGRLTALGSIQDPVGAEAWATLAQARVLLAWNTQSRHCPVCGAPIEMRSGGGLRVCSNATCGAEHFPRTDSAIIIHATHADRCLLARQRSFRPGLHSVLAGFVEPGESLENAVRREVEEEVGLHLADLSHVESQPWPFPASLMVGFTAEALDDAIRVDGREIESARWMTRQDVRHDVRNGALVLPSVKSIARRLIDAWLNANLVPGKTSSDPE
jgi:NAD+ diphosphatase